MMAAYGDPQGEALDAQGGDGTDGAAAGRSGGLVSRRTVMRAAAWSVPVIALANATPAFAHATSTTQMTGYPWSSWGVTWGTQKCKQSSNGKTQNTYSWNIDNTSGSKLDYHGVRFYAKNKSDLYGSYSNIINVYYLPFAAGSVNRYNTSSAWTTLAVDTSYPNLVGPNGATYYPWVTRYSGSFTVNNKSSFGSITVGGTTYQWVKTPSDYKFTIDGYTTDALPAMWVTHSYYAERDGKRIVNTSSINGNWTGPAHNYSEPNSNDANSGWRNNNWVKVPGADVSCTPINPPKYPKCEPPYDKRKCYYAGDTMSSGGYNYVLKWQWTGNCWGYQWVCIGKCSPDGYFRRPGSAFLADGDAATTTAAPTSPSASAPETADGSTAPGTTASPGSSATATSSTEATTSDTPTSEETTPTDATGELDLTDPNTPVPDPGDGIIGLEPEPPADGGEELESAEAQFAQPETLSAGPSLLGRMGIQSYAGPLVEEDDAPATPTPA